MGASAVSYGSTGNKAASHAERVRQQGRSWQQQNREIRTGKSDTRQEYCSCHGEDVFRRMSAASGLKSSCKYCRHAEPNLTVGPRFLGASVEGAISSWLDAQSFI